LPNKKINNTDENININDCGKIKSLADEYLHNDPELSDSDREIIDGHLEICADCAGFFAEEKKYLDGIKSAEYTPDKNISESVMNMIISGKTAADKPRRKIYVPFGLVSAAVIVLVMFAVSKGGLMNILNIFTKTSNIANNNAGMSEPSSEQYTMPYVPGGEIRAAAGNADNTANTAGEATGAYTESAEAGVPDTTIGIAAAQAPMPRIEAAPAGAAAPAALYSADQRLSLKIVRSDILTGGNNISETDANVSCIIRLGGAYIDKNDEILKDADTVLTKSQSGTGSLVVILDKKYKDTIIQNLHSNNLKDYKIYDYEENKDSQYMAIFYWQSFDYPGADSTDQNYMPTVY